MRRLRLYGHRGASIERPENTIESFARAIELGADALETDVHLTADGHIVCSHDPTGGRAAGVARAIRDVPLSELRRWDAGWGFVAPGGERPFAGRGLRIPTLHELLDAFPEAHLNLDVKQREPSMVAPLLKLLRDRGASERVTLASFHGDVIRAIRRSGYRGETALSQREVVALLALPAGLWRSLFPIAAAVQIPPRFRSLDLASPRFLARCHAAGLRVDYWVINDPAAAETLLVRGADGIMTDDPAAIAPVFAKRERG